MDNLGKIIAILFLIVFFWVMYPHFVRGEWIAPTAVAPGTWMAAQAPSSYSEPQTGYGWFRFDVWNNPPSAGRPVYTSDFRL